MNTQISHTIEANTTWVPEYHFTISVSTKPDRWRYVICFDVLGKKIVQTVLKNYVKNRKCRKLK